MPNLPGGTTMTRAHRWAGDLADDIDPVMIGRLTDGERPTNYTAWERREAVRRLRLDGLTLNQIAARLRIDQRQVSRDLERSGLTRIGWQHARYDAAARRRVTSARLFAAGLRTIEVARLLDVPYGVAKRDQQRTGFSGPGFDITPGRSRDVLLATYEHLLDNDRQEASA